MKKIKKKKRNKVKRKDAITRFRILDLCSKHHYEGCLESFEPKHEYGSSRQQKLGNVIGHALKSTKFQPIGRSVDVCQSFK